jgi:tRNA dimethylallyltransferase
MKERIVFLVGPTAIGKSKVAVSLAKKINAEIISCDSMQIYKGADIVTSKPPLSLRKKAAHHLLGIISTQKEYDVSKYRKDALLKIKEILAKEKVPLLVGGTGLYMTILLDGIFKDRAQDRAFRQRLYKKVDRFGSHYLHAKLAKIDSAAASKIHPNDAKRIIRALEVYKVTGRPISLLQKQRVGLWGEYDIKIFCLNLERDKLNQRIALRVDKMFKQGLMKEVKSLLRRKLSRTACCAIGIKELKGYFNKDYDLDTAKSLMVRNTCLYAKRQLTWFRKDKRINWLTIEDKQRPADIARRIFKKIKG